MKTHVNLILTAAFLVLFSGGCFSSAKSTVIDSSADANFGFESEVVEDYSITQGQPSRENPDCRRNVSLYDEDYKQKNYEMAWEPWMYAIENCPDFGQNLYIHGFVMVRDKINKETDPKKREELIDFLLSLYDKRIQYFGNEGINLSRKAAELRHYRPEQYMELYELTEKSIEIDKISATLNALVMHLESTIKLSQEAAPEVMQKFNVEKILERFEVAMAIIQENLKKVPENIDDFINTATTLENMVLPFANCQDLIKIYEPRFADTPNDSDLLTKITAFLIRSECTDSELYFNATRNLHRLNPSAQSAYNMGRMEEAKENFTEAIGYYDQALEMSNGDNGIDKYFALMRIANMYDNMSRFSQARSYALRAAEERPNDGRPWIMIANMYARSAGSCGHDEISTAAVYWAAADKAQRARNVDNDPDVVSAANRMIANYSARFPDRERLFMLGLDGGQTVRVGCWIGESTTTRPRP